MTKRSIISQEQALQILKNDLRKRALEKHAAALEGASAERRKEILAEINREIDAEVRKRAVRRFADIFWH